MSGNSFATPRLSRQAMLEKSFELSGLKACPLCAFCSAQIIIRRWGRAWTTSCGHVRRSTVPLAGLKKHLERCPKAVQRPAPGGAALLPLRLQ